MNNQERKKGISCNQNKVILSLTQDLQRLSLQLVNSMRGRSRIKYGMTALCHNGGFTLIELLVVVLIIAILAAVALPQYQKAVEKSRAAEAVVNLRALANAFKVYKLANGTAPSSLDELDVSISSSSSNFFEYTLTNIRKEIVATRKDKGIDLYKYYIYVSSAGQVSCVAKTEQAKPVCANVSGVKNGAYQNNMYYYTFPQVNFFKW